MDHHHHEELPLSRREAEAARACTRASVTLSNVSLRG